MRILRKPEVSAKTGLSTVTIWRAVRAGTFPQPLQLTPKSVGWYEHEIDAYLETLPRVSAPAKVAA